MQNMSPLAGEGAAALTADAVDLRNSKSAPFTRTPSQQRQRAPVHILRASRISPCCIPFSQISHSCLLCSTADALNFINLLTVNPNGLTCRLSLMCVCFLVCVCARVLACRQKKLQQNGKVSSQVNILISVHICVHDIETDEDACTNPGIHR